MVMDKSDEKLREGFSSSIRFFHYSRKTITHAILKAQFVKCAAVDVQLSKRLFYVHRRFFYRPDDLHLL